MHLTTQLHMFVQYDEGDVVLERLIVESCVLDDLFDTHCLLLGCMCGRRNYFISVFQSKDRDENEMFSRFRDMSFILVVLIGKD